MQIWWHSTWQLGEGLHASQLNLSLGSEILEQVDSYHYLGVKNSPGQTSYIEQVIISTKARRLVGMLYRESYPWADTATLLNLYVTSFGASMPTVCGIRTPTRTSLCLSQSKSSHVSVFEMVGLRLWQHATSFLWQSCALATAQDVRVGGCTSLQQRENCCAPCCPNTNGSESP